METFTKKKLIDEYKEGDSVSDIFVVKFKKGVSDYVKGYYFSLLLTDSSGKSVDYRYWGGPEENLVKEIYDSIKEDSVIFVEGQFSFYRGKPQIASNQQNTIKVVDENSYNKEDFIKKTQKDIPEMIRKLDEYIERVENEKLKLLLKSIFSEELKEAFVRHPAAISLHHNWIGGLLEHTLEIIRYCETSKEIFPELDMDLLITGALLHDIGKIDEMETTTRIKGTKEGMFVGHLIIGSVMVSKKMDEVGLDKDLQNKILHMIISHHGKIEVGAVKEPMFPEALTLHYADLSSSKITEMLNFINQKKGETEDDFMPKWEKNKPTNIFLGKKENSRKDTSTKP